MSIEERNAQSLNASANPANKPSQLRVSKDRKTLTIHFSDGSETAYPAEMLRVFSPSAEVQGHSPDQRKIVSGKRNVEIMSMDPVGNYAVRITFDDMHSTGIYSWVWFRDRANNMDAEWQAYLDELDQMGLER